MDLKKEQINKELKSSNQIEKIKRNKDVIIILGIFTIINLFIINSLLKPFSKEVVNTSKFTEYYQNGEKDDLDDVFMVLSRNYYTIKKNYNLKDKSILAKPEVVEESKEKNNIQKEEIKENINSENVVKEEKVEPVKEKLVEKQIYTVKSGDALLNLSEKYSQSLSIIKANNPKITTNLQVGQKIMFPSVNGIYYTVKNGDNLYDISIKYKVDVDVIRKYNNISGDTLQIGQEIFLKDPSLKALPSVGVTENFKMPVRYKGITSPYGNRFHPVLKRYILHSGVDLVARYIPVTASKAGTVTFVGVAGGYGNLIKIKHSDGYETRYAHLNKMLVKKGQKINQGQLIGESGMTGRVTGPHLHFEVRKNGKPVNPMNYLKRK